MSLTSDTLTTLTSSVETTHLLTSSAELSPILVSAPDSSTTCTLISPVDVPHYLSSDGAIQTSTLTDTISGPQGPPGIGLPVPDGNAEYVSSLLASYPIGGHRAVAWDDIGQAVYADATKLTHVLRVVGISTFAVTTGVAVTVQRSGVMSESSWAWDITKPIYFDGTGVLTQTPVVGAAFVQVLAMPITLSSIEIKIQPPIIM